MRTKIIVKLVTIPDRSPLSGLLAAELAALQATPNDTIDTSDVPPLSDHFWKHAVINPFYKPG